MLIEKWFNDYVYVGWFQLENFVMGDIELGVATTYAMYIFYGMMF